MISGEFEMSSLGRLSCWDASAFSVCDTSDRVSMGNQMTYSARLISVTGPKGGVASSSELVSTELMHAIIGNKISNTQTWFELSFVNLYCGIVTEIRVCPIIDIYYIK